MRGDADMSDESERLRELFMQIVEPLAEGELTFPSPFDLASSVALAANIDTGRLARLLFDATASRDCGYEVRISALAPPGSEHLRRDIINTSVASTRLLFALLDGLMEELEQRRAAS